MSDKMDSILQSESSECGLACLAMVAQSYGHHTDLRSLRHRFSLSLKGLSLDQLMVHAAELHLSPRPLRLDLDEIPLLKLPAILHWDLNHFVVLTAVKRNLRNRIQLVISDPACGRRTISLATASVHFTGVALELTPTEKFRKVKPAPTINVSQVSGKIIGLPGAIIQAVALAAALQVFSLVTPLFTQFIMDEVVVSGDLGLLKTLAVGFGIVAVGQILIGFARSIFLLRWSTDIGYQWAVRLFGHLIHLSADFFEKRNLGDITSKFGSIQAIQSTMTSLLVESLLDGLMALLALAMMLFYSPLLTAIAVAGVLLYAGFRYAFYRYLRDASMEKLIYSASENSYFLETIRAVVPLKLFGHEDERRIHWQNLKMAALNKDVLIQKVAIWFRTVNGAISSVQNLALFYFGATLIVQKSLSVGMLVAFASYASTFTSRIFSLVDLSTNVKLLTIHLERVADIALEDTEERASGHVDLGKFRGNLSVESVSFRYADGEPEVLDQVSFVVKEGDSVAIVGPSGSGKTTLCKLLLGLQSPSEGKILIDGTDIRRLGLNQYRKLVGTVMQDDFLLSGSLLENITFFSAVPDIHFAEECCERAAIHNDIMAMPMRYQTLVGELGSTLSGGQKQRILLARALYKRPKILVLDEATSHLDPINESRVNAALKELGITRLIVAHRRETINSASRVILLQNGKMVENHARELLI